MSTWRGSSPKVSRRGVVVTTKLVEPSVPGASCRTTSPATVRGNDRVSCRRGTAKPDGPEYPRRAWLRDRRASYGVGWLTLTQDWGQLGWWRLCELLVCGTSICHSHFTWPTLPTAAWETWRHSYSMLLLRRNILPTSFYQPSIFVSIPC